MKKAYWGSLILLSAAGFGQDQTIKNEQAAPIDLEQRRELDLGDLYHRVATSRFAVVGTVVKHEGVGVRSQIPSIDSNMAGDLYTINVEKVVCRQTDFDTRALSSSKLQLEPEIPSYLFVPYLPLARGKEKLALGQRYLLFLFEPAREKQKEWTKSFELDPRQTYYRGEELSRGVIPLAKPTPENPMPEQPLVLEKVTRLCDALRPKDVADKLAALNKLAASGDPILANEAELAAKELRKHSD